MRWFTSDLHLGDPWTTKMRYCGEDTAKHDNWLAARWDAMVAPDDEVYVLGDVARGMEQLAVGEWLKARPGHKNLIRGNHDMRLTPWDWIGLGFETVFDERSLRLTDDLIVWLSHYPTSTRPAYAGTTTLHGHTHRRVKAQPDARNGGLLLHVGWDAWRRMVPQDALVELMEENRGQPDALVGRHE